jgi:glycosyltransferase involved in cell wall biosynthesis
MVRHDSMHILWLDAFHGGSHAAVSQGFTRHSQHAVTLLTLSPAGGWRWRMRGAAVTFAREVRRRALPPVDLIVATDMLDLATFLGLTRDLLGSAAVALYMHENQLTYPLPPGRTRDLSFPWINYTSALAADAIFFNSAFHRDSFFAALPGLPGRYHDYQELDLIDSLVARSHVLSPGIDLARLDPPSPAPRAFAGEPPILLWNSRWEYDKGPETFFTALTELKQRQIDFRLIVIGEHIDPQHPAFAAAREEFVDRTLAWGYVPDLETYRRLLHRADIVVSTAMQEFFGIAVVEAIFCGCAPLLPRRLSYPELIPPHLHPFCFYDDDAQLAGRLSEMMAALPSLREIDFRSLVAQYDWSQMAARYDAAFADVVTRRGYGTIANAD